MNINTLKNLTNFLPQNIRNKASNAITKALEMIDPSQIKTKQDAIKAMQNLKSSGLPDSIINKVNLYLNNPIATPIMAGLGINKEEFKNGLQSIIQPDNSSASTGGYNPANYSSLLQGIDQL